VESLCPVCEESVLIPCMEVRQVEFEGRCGVLACHYSICPSCGCEVAGAAQLQLNRELLLNFKRGDLS
jgi:HTH-type transcriptional regulator / antitoxin MqsA